MEKHVRLFIPGPVEVRKEILEAQTAWMIGHRSGEFAELYARLQPKLMQSFVMAAGRVLIYTSSGSGAWESASRCLVRDEHPILHLVNGAFSDRWAKISQANGKQTDIIEVEWGQAVLPEQLEAALAQKHYDAVAVVYNETSTGVLNPVPAYAEIMKRYPETLFLVDVVSAYLGAEVRVSDWGIDFCLTSSQKAMALPPGIAFATVTDRALDRAKNVKNRGYYFDIIEMEKAHQKNNTPATPPISLMFAADKQLDAVLAEGLEARWARHLHMAEMTRAWAAETGFEMFSAEGYHSPTVTTVKNSRNIVVGDLNKFLRARGMVISNGYGKTKDQAMRIAHMGDTYPEDMQALFQAMNDFLATL
jgi:predicted phosphoserine aminotransferase